jgi:hypothetical protein
LVFCFALSLHAVFADCAGLLLETQRAVVRPQFRFSIEGNEWLMPSFQGKAKTTTSMMGSPFIYVTTPQSGGDYVVIKKGDVGFGFSAAKPATFEFLDSKELVLNELRSDGTRSFFLALISGEQFGNSVVAKVARTEDAETGRLGFGDFEPLLLEGVDHGSKHFSTAARPESTEFWMSDGSENLRVLQLGEKGMALQSVIRVQDLLGSDPEGSAFKALEGIQFSSDGQLAFVIVRSQADVRWLVPIRIAEVPNEKEDSMSVSYESSPERAIKLESEEQLVMRPDRPLLMLIGGSQIRVLSFQQGSVELTEILRSSEGPLNQREGVVAFDYHWDGILQPTNKEQSKFRFVGDLKSHVMIFDPQRNTTKLLWLNWGQKL